NTLVYTDPDGRPTTYSFDSTGLGLLTRTQDGITTQDGGKRTVNMNLYDVFDRVCSQQTFGDPQHLWGLGIVPGEAVQTDPYGNRNWTYFDARGRKICYVDPVGNVSQWTYDGVDELTQFV